MSLLLLHLSLLFAFRVEEAAALSLEQVVEEMRISVAQHLALPCFPKAYYDSFAVAHDTAMVRLAQSARACADDVIYIDRI